MAPDTRTARDARDGVHREEGIPPLEAGDRLDQVTFHERYEAMPPDSRAELIGGVVHVPSPVKPRHAGTHADVMMWLGLYASDTPGVSPFDNATAILGPESEPQPDASLIVVPECGGQTRYSSDEYLVGAPELIVEIASSTESIDLHTKRDDYQQAGVKEYVVAALRQGQVFWFSLNDGRFQETQAGADGMFRSRVFPGLWLDPVALLRRDLTRIRAVLQEGVASAEHSAFVAALAAARSWETHP